MAVNIKSNDTSVVVRAILSGGSVVDVMSNDLTVSVSKDLSATWDKPDITFSAGPTGLNLNQSDYSVATFDSIRYFNGIRLASTKEIEDYQKKKGRGRADLENEIVTGYCGTPIVELVKIDSGQRSSVDLPPLLDLGKVIEDINNTLSSLQKSRLTKSRPEGRKKYQLMDISLTIPTLYANFLEAAAGKSCLSARLGQFGINKNGLLGRWKFHIKEFEVKIKRHTPPEQIQRQIREMDEDKSRTYLYGPMIQGGDFDIHIGRIICTLHPLNLATPLGDIGNFQINGLIYLAPLSPSMEGLIDGHQFCVPVKCHHGINSPSNDIPCSCDYAVINTSRDIPVKIYHRLNLSSDHLHSNYGDVLMPSIPHLMNIIQRLIPKPPIIDQRSIRATSQTPPLDWWDNLRFQFHGTLKWRVEKMTFRWLLDSVTRYDWSIFLSSNNFLLSYSIGSASLEMDRVVISLPDPSYHMMEFNPLHSGAQIVSQYLENAKPGFRKKRHPLILFPKFRTQFHFIWEVSPCNGNHSSKHHNVYIKEKASFVSSNDKFEYFRSCGWEIVCDIKLSGDPFYASWIALRGDVLPWITHKAPRAAPPQPPSEDESDPLPKVKGIQVNVDISTLNVGVWFDEKNEMRMLTSKSDEPEGIYVQIPELKYTLSAESEHSIDLNGSVQAALLDMTERSGTVHLPKPPSLKEMEWLPKHYPQSYAEINNAHSFQMFDTLQHSVKNTKTLEYLLIVDQIKILDKALDDILQKGNNELHHVESSQQETGVSPTKEEAPWTVLVAGMKLLWTVDIRDSVVSIVKDVLFAINFMQVNSRGTPQLLDAESDKKISLGNDLKSTTDEVLDDGNGVEIIIGDIEKEVTVISNEPSDVPEGEMPKSSLDYLLSRSIESKHHSITAASPSSQPSRYEFTSRTLFNNLGGNKSPSSLNEIIPTFDLHLSNPQIQFHSEKTGGSVIIGICGAYIEGRKFAKLFADREALNNDDLRLETLLRRTEFVYTLDRMQLFSMSSSVDVEVGLQWLKFEPPDMSQSAIETIICNDTDTSSSLDQSLENIYLRDSTSGKKSCLSPDVNKHQERRQVRIKSERTAMFPDQLSIFDTKEFVLPNLCQSIMDPSTFKTRQEFHRPPIDLTKEELADVIDQKLVLSLDIAEGNKAIDGVEMFLDELSFNLDSYQFSTTLDVIRNVILEPPKPRQERYYQVNNDQMDADVSKVDSTGDIIGKEPFEKMERALRALREGSNKQSKRGREHLRSLANELLVDIEDEQPLKSALSPRRIEYTLCKAKWKIACPDSTNNADAVITFTGFKGIHDFTVDGSVNSQISLEDLHVISENDASDAMVFSDPSVILKTVLGVERSACQRCGLKFDRGANEVDSCIFHSGVYQRRDDSDDLVWTCCGASQYDATGCVARPHTGTERAASLQFDALPRKLDGLTMYKHLEGNMYPGVPYTIIVQLTKSTIKSFMDYFLGSSDDSFQKAPESDHSQNRSRDSFDDHSVTFSDASSQCDPDEQINRKFLLFGSGGPKLDFDFRGIPPSPTPSTKQGERKEEKNENPKGEICFIKNWRLGEINICLSVAGFGKFVDTPDLNLVVSSFERAYKIGTVDHLARKLIAHLLKSLMVNSPELLKAKFVGMAPKNGNNNDHRNNLDALHEGEESDEEEAAGLLFTHTNNKKKKKRWLGKKN